MLAGVGLASLLVGASLGPALAFSAPLAPSPAAPAAAVAQTSDGTADEEFEAELSWTLGRIDIGRSNIYSQEVADESFLARLANWTHWTTRESVIRREIWFDEGEPGTERLAAELERNLRATGLFGEVRVRLLETDDLAVRDLEIRTRDRLTLSGGASVGVVGDIASGGVSLSESNLFGTGDRIRFGFFENDQDEFRGSVSYRDRYFLGTWTTMNAEIGRTDAGDFARLRFARPFRYLEDRFGWGVSGGFAEAGRDYFFLSDRVALIPFEDERLAANTVWRSGTPSKFVTGGITTSYLDRRYGAGIGPAVPTIRIPGDTRTLFVGGTFRWTSISDFRKARGFDTIDFVQDIQLGTTARVELGGTYRDEIGFDEVVQPTGSGAVDLSFGLGEHRLFRAAAGGAVRLEGEEAVGWSINGDLRAYDTSYWRQTIALATRYIEAEETQDLPVQFLLGEGNGLRGYPRREFTGERVLTINLEDRIDLGVRVGSFELGAAVFTDFGWIADRDESLGRPLRSVGIGLRIGSDSLLGAGIGRVDLSFPLDDFEGNTYDPLFSVSLGQAFTFR